jgi:hypothetical protein
MKPVTLALCALALAATTAAAATQTWVGFQIGISGGNAPPMAWRDEPHVVMVDEVWVVDDSHCDEDVFRYGNTWWRMRGGWWYRSASWRGPWRSVDVRIVPGAVLRVPRDRWHHHPLGGPPGLVRSAARHDRVIERRVDRRQDRRQDRREDRREDRRQDRRDARHDKGHGKQN